MGMLSRLSTTVAPARARGESAGAAASRAFWGGDPVPGFWLDSLTAMGVDVSPELALTLSHVHCAVSSISDDFGTMTCQMFENLGEDGRKKIPAADPMGVGISALAFRLRWQPNYFQSAKAFWSTLAWQYLLRRAAYAEIIPGPSGFADQIVPRHPDRVEEQVYVDGAGQKRLRYLLREPNGQKRVVLEDQMFVVRNTSTDGLNAVSRIAYGAQALASSLALQEFTRQYFKHGATASTIATYKGSKAEEEWEDDLHKSITRYMSGVENAGGLLLVPEDIDVKALGVAPKDAELLGLKNLGGRDVARMYKMPPLWLAIEGTASYNSQLQDAQNYVNRCQMPMVVEFEQAIQRCLVLRRDKYFAKFNMDYLLRGDLKSRMEAYEIGIRSRIYRPSDARRLEDMNPDADLDKLSEGDNRPGAPAAPQSAKPTPPREDDEPRGFSARAHLKGTLVVHDSAVRCLRRQRAAIEKLAKKHAGEPKAWAAALFTYFADDFAPFVATTMRISPEQAKGYAANHEAALLEQGVAVHTDAWERAEADELCALALGVAA